MYLPVVIMLIKATSYVLYRNLILPYLRQKKLLLKLEKELDHNDVIHYK